MLLSIVIPVFNNAETLSNLVLRLVTTFAKEKLDFEIIFINDGSLDNSLEILRQIATDNSKVKVLSLSRNYGQHPAISAGFEIARGDYVVLMDADLQDRPEDIPILLNKIQSENLDILYSIRTSNQNRQSTRLTSKLYHYAFSKIVGTFVPKNVGTFRIFTSNFLKGILKFKEKDVLYGPLMFFMGYKSDYINIPYIESWNNKSSYTFIKRLSMAFNSLMTYTDLPLKFFLTMGVGFFSFSALYLLIIMIQYFFKGTYLPDGTTLIVVLISMGFGALTMFMGIIGMYLFKIYQAVLDRPRYLIREMINNTDDK